jgi:hypothetical protein
VRFSLILITKTTGSIVWTPAGDCCWAKLSKLLVFEWV